MTAPNANFPGADEIEEWFRNYIATLTGVTMGEVQGAADFESFGIDSIQGVDMVTALETRLGMSEDLPLEYVFEASSISEAAQRVSDALRDGTIIS
ncbi:MAG TPA: acyl carrier protein [Sphingobium sp.]